MDESSVVLNQRPPAAALLGREFLGSDPITGEVRLSYFARPDFANRHGTVHGGLLAAMLDSAAASVLFAVLQPEFTLLTVNLNTSFLRPAPLGKLFAVARIVSQDRRQAEVETELLDPDNNVVAKAKVSLRIVRRSHVASPKATEAK